MIFEFDVFAFGKTLVGVRDTIGTAHWFVHSVALQARAAYTVSVSFNTFLLCFARVAVVLSVRATDWRVMFVAKGFSFVCFYGVLQREEILLKW